MPSKSSKSSKSKPHSAPPVVSGERPLRVVLAGCGGMSRAWTEAAARRPGIEIAALVDLRREAAEARAAAAGLASAHLDTDLARAIQTVKADAVFDVTIPAAHKAVVTTALRHGCHVLGEKPMATSMAEARAMAAAARKARRIYAVTQNYRYRAPVRRLRAFLQSGAIGEVHSLFADFFLGAHFGGFRDQMKHVLLVDMAIHTFDAARFLSGANARAVTARDWNPKGSWFRHGASAVADFEMDRGIAFQYRGSWCAEGNGTSWNARWRIVGTKGSVCWDGEDGFSAESVAATGGFTSQMRPEPVPDAAPEEESSGHESLMREFERAVRGGPQPETRASDNLHSLAMVFAAVRGAETRRRALCS